MKEKNVWDKGHEYLMDWSTMQLPLDALTEQKTFVCCGTQSWPSAKKLQQMIREIKPDG